MKLWFLSVFVGTVTFLQSPEGTADHCDNKGRQPCSCLKAELCKMAVIEGRPNVTLELTLRLTEAEAGALDALAGYGTDAFLEWRR